MTDIITVLPNIHTRYPHIRPLLDRHTPTFDAANITVLDLVALEPRAICQKARISLNDVIRIADAVRDALNEETFGTQFFNGRRVTQPVKAKGISTDEGGNPENEEEEEVNKFFGRNMEALRRRQKMIQFGDEQFDEFLGTGIMTGSMVEFVGESGVGKTQLLLRLCFSIQQPPHNRNAVYICTESQISTKRMNGMLEKLIEQQVPGYETLSTDRIQTAMCQYLDTLDHIIRYQLPVAIERFNIGLVIVDSIAANFRVEDEEEDAGGASGTTPVKPKKNLTRPAKLAKRAGDVVRLGTRLKEMALKYNVAVVVANQVSDRFMPEEKPSMVMAEKLPWEVSDPSTSGNPPGGAKGSQGGSGGAWYELPSDEFVMTYDYQAKWFTGWGDDLEDVKDPAAISAISKLKNPMLGMAWTNMIDGRVALIKGNQNILDSETGDAKTRRWIRVVFMPWARSGPMLEYEIWEGGVRSVSEPSEGSEDR